MKVWTRVNALDVLSELATVSKCQYDYCFYLFVHQKQLIELQIQQ